MKLITFESISNLGITYEESYKWTSEMIEHKNETLLPPKISIKPVDGVFCNVMPTMVPTESGLKGGLKMVTRYPSSTPALLSDIILFDAETGERLAYMDCTWITAMRTGAVAAHSILLLAKKDFKTIGIMGLGNVSRAALLFLESQINDRDLTIKLLKYKGQEQSFIDRFSCYPNLHFEVVDTNYEVVKGSDVVISGVTYAPKDFCENDAFDEGVLVVPIHTLGFTNCDLFFDKVYGDDYGHECHFKYFNQWNFYAEVHDVVNGTKPGRENEKERILAYNVGIAAHDANFAWHIYNTMKKNSDLFNKLPEVDMKEPTEKFWI